MNGPYKHAGPSHRTVPMRWPVYGFAKLARKETVAVFLDWSAAVDFVSHSAEQHFVQRSLYIAEPIYDRRKATWCVSEPKAIGDGRYQVAA